VSGEGPTDPFHNERLGEQICLCDQIDLSLILNRVTFIQPSLEQRPRLNDDRREELPVIVHDCHFLTIQYEWAGKFKRPLPLPVLVAIPAQNQAKNQSKLSVLGIICIFLLHGQLNGANRIRSLREVSYNE
jgi:hypothetical protein